MNGFQFDPNAASFVPCGAPEQPNKSKPVPCGRSRPSPVPSPRSPTGVSLTDFQIIATIGDGLVGRVYLVRYELDRGTYAMKVIPKDQMIQTNMAEHIQAERLIQSTMSEQCHPFMVPLYFAFQDDAHVFLIQEYVPGGDLRYHLNSRGRLPVHVSRFIAAELLIAIEHLHLHRIIHRDIKASNVLIHKDGHIRLTDFGMSKQMNNTAGPDSNHQDEPLAHTFCGTQPYMAPEILRGKGYSQVVDWWAFGVLLHEMLTGQQPFVPARGEHMLAAIANAPLQMSGVPDDAAALIRSLLAPDLESRLSDGTAIRNNVFFSEMDWEALRVGTVPPPWTPYCDMEDDEDVANFPFDVTDRTPPTTEDFAEDNRNAAPEAVVHLTSFSYVSPAMRIRGNAAENLSSYGSPVNFTSSSAAASGEAVPFSMENATPIMESEWMLQKRADDGSLDRMTEHTPTSHMTIPDENENGSANPADWECGFSMSL